MESKPKLSIILVAINNLEITKRCLSSLEEFTQTPFEIILIDNASSNAEAADYYASLSHKNLRFDEVVSLSEAWNKGIELSIGEFVAVINNDTVVPPGWDSPLIETLESDPEAGMVSPLTFWLLKAHFTYKFFPEFERGNKQSFDTPIKLKPFDGIVWGEFCMFTRKALDTVGGYNPIYERAGSEDLEILFQLYDKGFAVYMDPRVCVWHQGHASRADDILPKKEAEDYDQKNYELFKSRWPEQTSHWG